MFLICMLTHTLLYLIVGSESLPPVWNTFPHVFLLIDSSETLLWIILWFLLLSSPFHRFKPWWKSTDVWWSIFIYTVKWKRRENNQCSLFRGTKCKLLYFNYCFLSKNKLNWIPVIRLITDFTRYWIEIFVFLNIIDLNLNHVHVCVCVCVCVCVWTGSVWLLFTLCFSLRPQTT